MCRLRNDARICQHFDYARYTVDVTFKQSKRPPGNMPDRKKYLSEKHMFCEYQGKLLVLPIGTCIGCTKCYPGSVSYLEIFWQHEYFHHGDLKKVLRDLHIQEYRNLQEIKYDYWRTLPETTPGSDGGSLSCASQKGFPTFTVTVIQ